MKSTNIMFILFLLITFVIGLYATVFYKTSCGCKKEGMYSCKKEGGCGCKKEGMTSDNEDSSCPTMLVKRGNILMLYNSNKPIDSNNPIPFFNLDEYINYLEIQKQKGTDCPVLFLQEETNAQGENVYRMRPSPFDLQGGLPSTPNVTEDDMQNMKKAMAILDGSRDNLPYNKNQYAGFDPQGQHVGEYTTLDAIHDSTGVKQISDNPMDGNWAGTTYTQQMVDSGKYVENEITKPTLFNPKVAFFPDIPSNMPGPKDII
jgi:hypothetical protein